MEVGVFLGAFLGFVSGLAVLVAWTWWNRREQAVVYRNVAAVEVLHNLSALDGMLESVKRTEEGGFGILETTISRPRADALRAIGANADLMRSLTEDERVMVPQAVNHVDRSLTEYDQWPEQIGGAKGSIQVQLPDGSTKLSRELATTQLRETLTVVMHGQIGLLVVLLNNSTEGRLRPREPLRSLWRALSNTRKGTKTGAIQIGVTMPESTTDIDVTRPLVVWKSNGASSPSGTVIVLSHYGD